MSVVYLLRRSSGTGPIKIGCTGFPEQRLLALRADVGEDVEYLASARGGFSDEARLHRQFAAYRLEGEWFQPRPLADLHQFMLRTGELPPVPDDDRNLVIAGRYLSGEPVQDIANDVSLTRERVRQILRLANISLPVSRDRTRTLSVSSAAKSALDALLLRCFEARVPVYQVCDRAGVARSTPSRWKLNPDTMSVTTLAKMESAVREIENERAVA